MKASTRKQLNVRSDEAYERAHRLARRLGLTTQDVVVKALRALETEDAAPPDVSAEASADHVHKMLDEARNKLWGGGLPQPIDRQEADAWLYDENGLPH